MASYRNYILKVSLSKDDLIERIKSMEDVVFSLKSEINKNTTVINISRSYKRVRNAPITLTLVLEEKEENLTEIKMNQISPYFEGFWGDMYAAKSFRNDFKELLGMYLISMDRIT